MSGIGIISNRNARLNKLYPKIKDRMAFVVGRGGEVASTGTLDDTHRAIEEFKRVEIDMIAISGGDGTAHRTIEVMLEVYTDKTPPPVLLLPTGTQNMVPNSFGIRENPVATLLLAQARYRHNVPLRCVKRNLLKVNEHYSFMFGLGLAPRFLTEYYARGQTTHLGAAKLIVEYALGAMGGSQEVLDLAKSFSMRYRSDEGSWSKTECHSVFCSFVEELSLRFRCFPRAGWDKGIFESVILSATPFTVARMLPYLWWGSLKSAPGLNRQLVRTMELRLDRPEAYTLDGELYEPLDRFQISAGPELKFVVPGFRMTRTDPKVRMDTTGPWDMRFIV